MRTLLAGAALLSAAIAACTAESQGPLARLVSARSGHELRVQAGAERHLPKRLRLCGSVRPACPAHYAESDSCDSAHFNGQ